MKSFLKNALPIVLMVWPYLFLTGFLLDDQMYDGFLLCYFVMTVAVYILNIINAWIYKGEDAYYRLALFGMLLKIAHTPLYGSMYLVAFGMLVTMLFPPLGTFVISTLLIVFAADLLIMITSSMYGVSALVRAAKEGKVSKGFAVANGILHFLVVVDVFSAVCVFATMSAARRKSQADKI